METREGKLCAISCTKGVVSCTFSFTENQGQWDEAYVWFQERQEQFSRRERRLIREVSWRCGCRSSAMSV